MEYTNGMPDLKYSEETFREMYEALKALIANEANLAVQQIKEDLFADAPEIKHKALKALVKAEGKT